MRFYGHLCHFFQCLFMLLMFFALSSCSTVHVWHQLHVYYYLLEVRGFLVMFTSALRRKYFFVIVAERGTQKAKAEGFSPLSSKVFPSDLPLILTDN